MSLYDISHTVLLRFLPFFYRDFLIFATKYQKNNGKIMVRLGYLT